MYQNRLTHERNRYCDPPGQRRLAGEAHRKRVGPFRRSIWFHKDSYTVLNQRKESTMIANVTMAFQNAATTGEGLTQFLPEPRYVTFRVKGNGPVTGGAVTIECCPRNMTSTPPAGQTDTGSGKGVAVWTSLTTISVPADATVEYQANGVVGSVRARISPP
jgi:hypothetical protein